MSDSWFRSLIFSIIYFIFILVATSSASSVVFTDALHSTHFAYAVSTCFVWAQDAFCRGFVRTDAHLGHNAHTNHTPVLVERGRWFKYFGMEL